MEQHQPLVFHKIQANKHLLSKKEVEISEFVIEHSEFVTSHTITDIAKKVNVSESSINRFCKKIGYKGFNDFKMDLVRSATVNKMKNQSYENREVTYVDSIVLAYQNTLVNTATSINELSLSKSVELMKQVNRIFVLGTNLTRPAVDEFVNNMIVLGIQINGYTDPNDIKMIVGSISEKDLVIMIAPNLFSTDLYNVLMQLAENDIKVIGITNYDSPQLNELLFAKFIAFNHSFLKTSEVLSNNFPFLFISDILIGKLINSNPEYKKIRMKSDSSITKDTFLYDNYL